MAISSRRNFHGALTAQTSGRAQEAKTHTKEREESSVLSTSLVTLGVLESPESPSVDPSNLGSDRGHARLTALAHWQSHQVCGQGTVAEEAAKVKCSVSSGPQRSLGPPCHSLGTPSRAKRAAPRGLEEGEGLLTVGGRKTPVPCKVASEELQEGPGSGVER